MSDSAHTGDTAAPTLVGGRYEILHAIGEGAFFHVYKARDNRTTTTVVVKALKPSLAGNTALADRLEEEARALADLSHPRIVRVLDVVRENGAVYLVNEWVAGMSLAERIRRAAPMPPEVAVDLATDVARALAAAHALGLVHGDVRPENVLIGGDGRARLDDLAASRAIAAQGGVDRRNVLRWVQCAAPEVIAGAAPTAAADTYGVGALLQWMLAGQPPFPGDNAIVVALKVEKEPPRLPAASNPSTPPALEAVVARCLDKDARRRYPEAGSLLADLTRIQDGLRHNRPLDWTPAQTLRPVPPAPRPEPTQDHRTEYEVPRYLVVLRNLLLMLIGVGIMLSLWSLYKLFQPVQDVTVPDVIGQDQDLAMRLLSTRDLTGAPRDVESEKPKGEVVNQNPRAGAIRKPGSTVTIYVSRGPRLVTVPNITEMSVERARELGAAAGVNVHKSEEAYDDNIQKGYVISQDPGAGEQVPPGSRVKIVVSRGPEPPPPPPPVAPAPVDTGVAPTWGAPDTGTAPPVAAAPAPPTGGKVRSFNVRFQIPTTGYQEPVGMQIVVVDQRGETVPVDEQRRLGEFVSRRVDAVGDRVTVRVYLNGQLFSQETR
jgi:serine/threonine-protein kinase